MINTRRHFFKRATWKRKFAFLPVTCHATGKTIWFDYAWKGVAEWGKKVEVRWAISHHHTVLPPDPNGTSYKWGDNNTRG